MNRLIATLGLAALLAASPAGSADAKGPPRPPHPPHPPKHWAAVFTSRPTPDPKAIREIPSELSATTERAEASARRQLDTAVRTWLAEDGVPASWAPPQKLVDRMIVRPATLEPVSVKELTVFRATLSAEFSPERKREMLDAYGRQVAGRRLGVLGGVLLFVLACLAAVSGYIRADEATKGYFTNRLRVLAAAGVGAAGVLVYQVLT